jgi:predicted small lipoprotein YifL
MKLTVSPSFRHCLLVCLALTLQACGNKGPLTLPVPQTAPPAKAAAKKAPVPTPAVEPVDHISPPAAATHK